MLIMHNYMTEKSIGEIMTKKLVTIGTTCSAQEAAKKKRDKDVSYLLVIDYSDNGKLYGILTDLDLVRQVCVNDESSKHTIVQIITSSPLVTIDAYSSVEVAADIMMMNNVRHLLVVEDEDITKPLGIITPTDFTNYLKE